MFELLREGGPFVWILLVCSVVSLAFIFERGWALRRSAVLPAEVRGRLQRLRGTGELSSLNAVCESRPSALSRLTVTGPAKPGAAFAKNETR